VQPINLSQQTQPPICFVYHQDHVKMVCTVDKGSVCKVDTQAVALVRTFVPKEFNDTRVQVIDDLHGKVENTRLIDVYFTDTIQFSLMAIHAFMDCIVL
jgi:hypothetical protein